MTLKIISKNDFIKVETIVMAIYSNPGIGKTTLGFSTHTPLLIDFDRGAYRATNRKDTVQVESWSDVVNITPDDLKPYQTIVVDTVGRELDILTAFLISENPKLGQKDGSLSLKGYGALKSQFSTWLKRLKLFGKDVVLISHSSEDKNGDDLIERLDIQGGSKGEIYKSADAMGRLSIVNSKRMLNFSPTDTAFGKNPAQLEPIEIPDIATAPTFLGDVINNIKEKINALTEEQKQKQSQIADWVDSFNEAKTADEFNVLIKNTQDCDQTIAPIVKGALLKKIIEAGFKYDKKQKLVV